MQLDGLLRVCEIIVTGENDDLRGGQLLADKAAERQAVHERHLDVRDQNVRFDLPHQRQRHFPVGGFPGKDKAVLLPGNHIPQSFPNQALVFCQKNFKHVYASLPSSAYQKRFIFRKCVPLPGLLRRRQSGLSKPCVPAGAPVGETA